jgi:dihydroorotase
MDILLRQVTIIDPSSPFHKKKADILIQNGKLVDISDQLDHSADKLIDVPGLHVSTGWVDVFAQIPDPGFEYKETLESGANAAAFGGYTDVFLTPDSSPVVHNKSSVEYVKQRSKTLSVNFHPIGAVTKNIEGKELAEMYDMHHSGAIAFGDGFNSIQSSGVLLKALQYVRAIDKFIIQLPDDKGIHPNGLMNEGVQSTRLGLPGRPSLAEELMIARDIDILKYTGSKLHITGITSKKSIDLIKVAKQEGLQITCSVTPYHLFFTDNDLAHYDTNLKVNPPMRSIEDKEALVEAVLDGTIDFIASHHKPQHTDDKVVEFEYAKQGMIGLQTCFAAVHTAVPQLSPEKIVELFSLNARKRFGLSGSKIEKDTDANLTLFQLNHQWTFDPALNLSNSINSGFFGRPLVSKALGIINKGSLFLND